MRQTINIKNELNPKKEIEKQIDLFKFKIIKIVHLYIKNNKVYDLGKEINNIEQEINNYYENILKERRTGMKYRYLHNIFKYFAMIFVFSTLLGKMDLIKFSHYLYITIINFILFFTYFSFPERINLFLKVSINKYNNNYKNEIDIDLKRLINVCNNLKQQNQNQDLKNIIENLYY